MRFPLLILALLSAFLVKPVQAQQPQTNTAAALPWRRQVEQRLQALENRPAPVAPVAPAPIIIPGPAPAPIVLPPQIVERHYYYPPRQFLPIDPEPKQRLPIDPEPKQKLPLDPDPKQKLPIDPTPKQPLPIDPGPKQVFPPDPAPKQTLPLPADEAEPLQKLPVGPPTGFQRFTVRNAWGGPSMTKALARPVR